MHELLEAEHARTFGGGAEERRIVEAAEIEAFALEHDLGEEDAEQFQRELEAIGLEIRQPAEENGAKADKAGEKAAEPQPHVLVGSADSLQLFLADIGRHKLLTAAEEVRRAKPIERGAVTAKRRLIESNLRSVGWIAKGYRGLG